MIKCTIKIRPKTKRALDNLCKCLDESYDELILRLIVVAKNHSAPKLSRNTVECVEHARKKIKAGNFITEADAKKRLGLRGVEPIDHLTRVYKRS